MRLSLWVGLAMAFACQSSVDICGAGAVCGVDGVTYTDQCQLEAAGATFASAGACRGECRLCGDFECFGEPILDERGCPTCACECRDGDCPEHSTCISGSCVPKDAGIPPSDGAVPDAVPTDAGFADAVRPDAGCVVDSDCEPGICEGGGCIYPCTPGISIDCDDDGTCETLLGSSTHCLDCGDDCDARAPAGTAAMCLAVDGCQFPCVDGLARCGGSDSCDTDLTTRSNCGICSRGCGSDEICSAGTCTRCAVARCGNACVDIDNDPANCGGCGMPCPADNSCVAGDCVPTRCLNPDDPGWSCDGALGTCTCSCGPDLVTTIVSGLVTCPLGLPRLTCTLAPEECGAYDAHEVAACCLLP